MSILITLTDIFKKKNCGALWKLMNSAAIKYHLNCESYDYINQVKNSLISPSNI